MKLASPLFPLAAAIVLALSGCAATPGADAASGSPVRVVASTDVWGDIVQEIGGSGVKVTSIITDPGRDPHDYESDARDQLETARAQIVVENGGGYDDFLNRLTANAKGAAVLNAVSLSGLDQHPASGSFNEHIWYDYPAVGRVAGAIAAELDRVAPAQRARTAAGLAHFRAALAELEKDEADIRTHAKGKGVAITEPVPLYLTDALGLVNRTPAAFSSAIESGTDVAPAVLQRQLALLREHRVALVAYNEQTTGATTEQVLAVAKSAGVPVVGVRETLPDGEGYLEWMRRDLTAMKAAVTR
ncbi:MAG: zinc/manganese transport system substrate-binding protein [Microbacteriaceae bacterium]|jgi:zinc/manganese transport system substrate-binding protein|nr:zinc/manganese transport system substrate-binding protein [Microbacteriaceae bacterium]